MLKLGESNLTFASELKKEIVMTNFNNLERIEKELNNRLDIL